MKLIIGFILGVLVGAYVADNSTEHQRRRAADAAARAGRRLRQSDVGRAVTDNATQVADTATDRVVDAVDTAGDALSGAMERNDHQPA